jgi:L-alanine-DL-glutamate epimerase-like enolase superfamily enzyme
MGVKRVHPDDLIAMVVLPYHLHGMGTLPQLLMGTLRFTHPTTTYHYAAGLLPQEEGEIRDPQGRGLGVKLDHDMLKQYNVWYAWFMAGGLTDQI